VRAVFLHLRSSVHICGSKKIEALRRIPDRSPRPRGKFTGSSVLASAAAFCRVTRSPMIPSDLLLHAYRSGAFPMATPGGEIAWFSPDPRALIPLDEKFHIPHGLRRTLKRNVFEIRINTAFEDVMRG